MIAADHHGGAHLAGANELVDRKSGAGAVPVAEPADPSRQPLEGDPLGGQLQPALEQDVVGKEPTQRLVDYGDVGLVAGKRGPPKWADPFAEERPDIGRDEARVCKCLL